MNRSILRRNLILIFALIFLSSCGVFKSPEIKGKVVDTETGEPLAGANVKVAWYTGYGSPAGWHAKRKNTHKTITDDKGEFIIPSIKGTHAPFIGDYDGVSILVYKLGYKPGFVEQYGRRSQGGRQDRRKTDFSLKPLKTDEDYYDAYYHTSWISVDYDHRFQIEYLRDYIDKYSQSKEVRWLFIRIAYHYKELGEYSSAKKVYKSYLKQFPDSKHAKEEIETLRKKGVVK